MARTDKASCLQCGYLLRGLPDKGQCPECGEKYNTFSGENIADATTAGIRSQKIERKLATYSFGCAAAFFVVCTGVTAYLGSEPGVWIGTFLLLVCALGTVASKLSETDHDWQAAADRERIRERQRLAMAAQAAQIGPRSSPVLSKQPVPYLCDRCGQTLPVELIKGRCPSCGRDFDKGRSIGIKIELTLQDKLEIRIRRFRLALVVALVLVMLVLLAVLVLYVRGVWALVWSGALLALTGALYLATRIHVVKNEEV
ncbi:MAG: hypothetical protein GC164_03615 [Phycisphaera sp.]|nr:hypothetical protein [Phycisphaera sp.]